MLAEKINKARQAGFSDDEIVSVLGETDASLAGKIGKAREAGFGLNEILTELSGGIKERDSAFDPGYLAKQFAAGAAGTVTGKGQTLQTLGAETVGSNLEAVGRSLTPDVQSASDRFRNPRMGDSTIAGYGYGSVPGMVAEGLGSFAGELPARAAGAAAGGVLGGAVGSVVPVVGTAAGAALGSTIGGFAGPLVSSALTRFGPEVLQRQQNNQGQLSGSDYAVAAGSSLAQGALESLGMGKVLGTASQVGGRALGETARQAGRSAVAEGATEAGQGVISEVATNVGTKDSKLSVGGVVDAAVTGAVGGAGTGGTIRVAGDATRKAGDVIGNRGYTHPEELSNVAAMLQSTADGDKLKLGNRYDSAEVVKKTEAQIDTAQGFANKAVQARLKQLNVDGTISTEDMNKAIASLSVPTQEGFDLIQRYAGDIAEGVDAIQLAKQKATLTQLKKRAGLDRNPNKVTGGLTGVAERMIRSAANNVLGAGLGAGAVLTGYKGLGALGASAAAVGGAAPMAALIGGAALAPLALDKVMGTYDPVQNLVQSKSRAESAPQRAGAGLPSLAQVRVEAQAQQAAERQAEREAKQTAAYERNQLKQQALTAKRVRTLMNTRADAQAFDEQAFLDQIDQRATDEMIAESTQRKSNEQKAAKLAMDLAQAQQKLDLARNIVRPASEYESISQIRHNPETLQSYLDKAKLDLKTEGIKTKADKATKKGSTAQPEAKAESPKKGSKKATAEAQDTGVLSGPTQSASDTPAKPVAEKKAKDGKEPTQEDIDARMKKLIQQRRQNFLGFETLVKGKFPDVADTIINRLKVLDGRENNAGKGMKELNKLPNEFGDAGQFIKEWWISPDAKIQNTRLGRTFYSRKLGKVLMTAKEAEKSRGF
jgi:hypothetical protein